MAEKRMFAQKIIDSDAFLDMPLSSQALYFHLSMRADDEGFINNPKKIQRMIGASDDDMKVLLAKNFIIAFESGVIVIKHWKIHNYIRADRLVKTAYIDERALLEIKENGAYTMLGSLCPADVSQVTDKCQADVSIDKIRLDKNSKDIYSANFEEFWKNYPRKKEKAKAHKCYEARLKDGFSEDQLLQACINYAAECENIKRDEQYIKLGATFLSANTPFIDYLDENYTPMKKSNKSYETQNHREYDYDALMKSAGIT